MHVPKRDRGMKAESSCRTDKRVAMQKQEGAMMKG